MEEKSSIEGLWVLLVDEPTGQVPMLARAGNHETYVLGFKNMGSARKFMAQSAVDNAVPRMVVRGNRTAMLRTAQDHGAVGVLVDYDPATNDYAAAAELY